MSPAAVSVVNRKFCGTRRSADPVHGFTYGPDYVRHPASFAFLTQSLAQRGFVAVAIDVTGTKLGAFGEPDPETALASTLHAVRGSSMKASSLTKAATVTTRPLVGQAPADVKASSVKFLTGTKRYLPAMPKGIEPVLEGDS